MDDPELAKEGMTLIRHYGCAGCHEIRGLETEGRIGTELTVEGSKPVERLDFALLTHPAEREGWYNHKGFFEHKLADPAVFDQGKVRPHLEKLRMPNFHLSKEDITALTTFLLGAVDTTFPEHYRYEPEDERRAVQEGWWIARRYNCVGCHQISLTGRTALMDIPRYQDPDWQEQLPPQLFTEGARVQPDWLVGFLNNPALSETDIHRNGIRQYLHARMPTFNFTERQVMKLTSFFAAKSSQPVAYIPKELEPLTPRELTLARQLFSGRAAPCLKCHMTGDPAHDRTATAPNFLTAASRLKPDWTYRWLLEPAKLAPGTAMPSELFRQEGGRWIFAGPLPASFDGYEKDHARLLVRYMFQMTPAEVRRLGVAGQ
jgi:mono/diheme cytochrome c family protein